MNELPAGGLFDNKHWFNYVIVGAIVVLMVVWYFYFSTQPPTASLPPTRPSYQASEDQARRYLSDKVNTPSANQIMTAEKESLKYMNGKTTKLTDSAMINSAEEEARKYLNSSQ